MKVAYATVLAACLLSACNNNQTDNTASTDSVTTSTVTSAETNPPAASTTAHNPSEGDVSYNGGKVRVYRNNSWEDANDDVKFDNGVVISRNGRATRNGVEVEMEDGYVVDRDGNVWDKTGSAVGDAWDATKHGVKKAGKAIGNAAEKVGKKAKDVVD